VLYTVKNLFSQRTDLLEEEAVLKCSGENGILQLYRMLVIEKGDMP